MKKEIYDGAKSGEAMALSAAPLPTGLELVCRNSELQKETVEVSSIYQH